MMWKDKYAIGIEQIDDQHKELFKTLSDFIQIIQNENSWDDKIESVKETLTFMKEYVVFHFNDEEKYQEEINYPDMIIHKEEHRKFKESVNKYGEIFETEGYTEEKMQEFSAKLMTWLIMHVGKMDQKIADYVKLEEGQA